MVSIGADDGSRTHTSVSSVDFESTASAIPPHQQEQIYNSIILDFMQQLLEKNIVKQIF